MDFSKLSSNDKLAAIGAVLAIVGAFLSFGGGGTFGVLTGIAMLVIVFLPQFSPSTKLPGSKGSLMMIVGGVSALGAILGLLAILAVFGAFAFYGGSYLIGALIGTAGQALMAWAAWKEFQAEGGKFNLGTASGPSTPPAPPASTYTPPPPTMAPPAPPAMPEPMQEPMGGTGSSEDEPHS